VIVAGDFNTNTLVALLSRPRRNGRLRNFDGHGYIDTWPSWLWPQIPIDHVLVKGPIVVAGMGRGSGTGSDHHPVVADLHLIDR
jgi:endonuclease/exonuclease/phosphatase (EEP) superfamily protein YafD